MNWYKKAQTQQFSIWLSDEINRITHNFQYKPSTSIAPTPEKLQENIEDVRTWAAETNPDLSNYSLSKAIDQAIIYKMRRKYMSENELMDANRNAFLSEHQNINPNLPNFAVDMISKKQSIPPNIKSRINTGIHDITTNKYFESIPLSEIMNACETNNVVVLQEDGQKWSGFLIGGAECGSKEAEQQRALFHLAYKKEEAYSITKNALYMTWCKMSSGRYEVVAYVS